MGKSRFFTGQPILTQLLNLLDRSSIKRLALKGQHDRYYKSFDTYTHLVTMLYCVLNKCNSTREVVSGMKACQHKLQHLGIRKAPGKSTLCDANSKRSYQVFVQIYQQLFKQFGHLLPDSRISPRSPLYIADASTITLFQEIMKAPSMGKLNGKRKGGLKVHTLISAAHDVPVQIDLTNARDNDMTFLQHIHLAPGSFIVFDKGYVDYAQYQRLSQEGVFFVTRLRKGTRHDVQIHYPIAPDSHAAGVQADYQIMMGCRTHRKKIRLKARVVAFYDKDGDRTFEFLTNNFTLPAEQVAELYKKRWQIEILFKRIKQNYPLKYFLGDNPNAIKIQVWCAFIADLLLKIVHCQLKRKWSFSNLTSIVRLHLMSYIHLFNFLNDPDLLPSTSLHQQLEIKGLGLGFKT